MNEMQKMQILSDAILGKDENGNGRCHLLISIGNPDDDKIPEIDCGICELRKTETSEFVLFQCVFAPENAEGLRRCFTAMNSYATICENSNGEPDDGHMVFVVFEDNALYSAGYYVATLPSFFALTIDSLTETSPNTYLFAFRKDNTAAIFTQNEDGEGEGIFGDPGDDYDMPNTEGPDFSAPHIRDDFGDGLEPWELPSQK